MSLALDPRVRAATWRYSRRFAPRDRWDRYQDGLLAILEGERAGSVSDASDAINAAKGRQYNCARSERRELARRAGYADWLRSIRRDPPPGERADVPAYLEALIDSEYRAVVLRLWGHMEHAEVAAVEGTTRMAAQLRYRRGIERLRRIYDVR